MFVDSHCLAVVILTISSAVGCWQEVHYQGKASESDGSTVGASSANSSPSTKPRSNLEQVPPLAAEPRGDTLTGEAVSSAEMFGEMEPDEPAVVASPPAEADSPASVLQQAGTDQATDLAAWQAASKWSMAAALQAKGKDMESYGERLEQARYAARLLDVHLAPLPNEVASDSDAERLATGLEYLLDDAGPNFARQLNERFDARHAALAELAIKSHVLLLSYTPDSTRMEPVIAAIRQAAETSELPEDVWSELIDLLAERADFRSVKAAVFRLHRSAGNALSH